MLIGGAIADPDRMRAPVSLEMIEFSLRLFRAAINRIEHLSTLSIRQRAEQKVHEVAGFSEIAELHERNQRKARIAQPGVAIIPVSRATNPLRQRAGGRRDDRA